MRPRPEVFRVNHVSRKTKPREPSGCRPTSPRVPEKPTPGATPREPSGCRASTPRIPSTQADRTLPEASECAASFANDIPRKPPSATRVPRVFFPGTLRLRRVSRVTPTGRLPGYRRQRHVSTTPGTKPYAYFRKIPENEQNF